MQCICKAKFTLEKAIFGMDLMYVDVTGERNVRGYQKRCPLRKKITKMQKILSNCPIQLKKIALSFLLTFTEARLKDKRFKERSLPESP